MQLAWTIDNDKDYSWFLVGVVLPWLCRRSRKLKLAQCFQRVWLHSLEVEVTWAMGADKKDDAGLFGWKNFKIPDNWTVVEHDRTPRSVSLVFIVNVIGIVMWISIDFAANLWKMELGGWPYAARWPHQRRDHPYRLLQPCEAPRKVNRLWPHEDLAALLQELLHWHGCLCHFSSGQLINAMFSNF